MRAAYIVIAHGSRDSEANQAFKGFLEEFRRAFPSRSAEGAFLELAAPSLKDAIAGSVDRGAEEIFIIPWMLFSGRHVKKDIPQMIQEAKQKFPQVDFHYAGPLCEHPGMLSLLEDKLNSFSENKKR